MSKVAVIPHKDHLEKLTKATPIITGIAELIWNGLDASASKIDVRYSENSIGSGFEYISIKDNGTGMSYKEAQEAFKNIGGSAKKFKCSTEKFNRIIHGCEGKGRYKSLALGNFVSFQSIFIDKEDSNIKKKFKISIDKNDLENYDISELKICEDQNQDTGVVVEITNTTCNVSLFDEDNRNYSGPSRRK